MSINIGKKIKEAIRTAGLTQSDLAKRLGLTRQQITNWVVGKNSPSLTNLFEIIKLTGKDANFFFGIESTQGTNNIIGNNNKHINQNTNIQYDKELQEMHEDILLLKKLVNEILRR